MFFVIDFETSALTPWEGMPLTLGIVPVNEVGEILDEHLYVEFPLVQPDWHMPANLTSTESWWNEMRMSEEETAREAWEAAWVRDDIHSTFGEVVGKIQSYLQMIEGDVKQRHLCANPVAFDKMWMDYLFSNITDSPAPYHYRCLCLRSMRYGVEYGGNPEFGNSRDHHEIEGFIEHHALWDARMEALDLQWLMTQSRGLHESVAELGQITKKVAG
jgi:hypothetical protein